jgi:hypothetical protein
MVSYIKLIPRVIFAALQATYRYTFRTDYFPSEWPWKLAVIMGINKASIGLIPLLTVEEVLYQLAPDNFQGSKFHTTAFQIQRSVARGCRRDQD